MLIHRKIAGATVACLLALSGAAQAQSVLNVNVNGIGSFAEEGSPANVYKSYNLGAGAHITDVAYNVTLTAYGQSYLSEMTVAFYNSLGAGVFLTPSNIDGPGVGSYAGSAHLADFGLDFSLASDGFFGLEFFEEYVDGYLPDGVWAGTLSFTYTPATITAAVPEPETYALMLAGLGIVGWAAAPPPRLSAVAALAGSDKAPEGAFFCARLAPPIESAIRIAPTRVSREMQMVQKSTPPDASDNTSPFDGALADQVKAQAQQIWLAGMGAFARAQAEGTKMFEALVKDGGALQQKTQDAAGDKLGAMTKDMASRMSGFADDVQARAGEQWGRLEGLFDDGATRTLKKFGMPTAKDFAALSARVDTLSERLDALSTPPAARTATPAKKAAPARTRARETGRIDELDAKAPTMPPAHKPAVRKPTKAAAKKVVTKKSAAAKSTTSSASHLARK